MRVHIGSDHAGFDLKAHLLDWLTEHDYDAVDVGPESYQPDDDYPTYCLRTGLAVVGDPGSLGIVIGGSGNGEQMAANKVAGVRAALAWNEETASLARLHNDANVLSLGARMHTVDEATKFASVFLTTEFTGEERHRRRIAMLADYESSGTLPPPSS
jgi:ribose 5-phosphate isomerase B